MWMIMRRAGAHALEYADADTDAGRPGIIAKVRSCVGGHGIFFESFITSKRAQAY